MTEFSFYHLERAPLERVLPRLLERVLGSGLRAVILAGSPERVEQLGSLLWTYDPASFLAHGTAKDGFAGDQPVFLTTDEENPNAATVLVLLDGVDAEFKGGFERCLDLFDGKDSGAVDAARSRWRAAQGPGNTVKYWKQDDAGRWEQAAEV
ncbi:MAG: DNA polymerase III subunit chi [Proteobacteria bacterium]|nr:DNA polymerase III subunit chi [Pseudomonadota bacterium]